MSTEEELLTFDKIESKKKDFADLLDSIDGMEEKKKRLWLDIYENAFHDRMNAYMLFTELYASLSGDKDEHITLGPVMHKYLTAMNKSTDQLLKLADLIAKEQEKADEIDAGGLFKQIARG